jgi:hypothetical protein
LGGGRKGGGAVDLAAELGDDAVNAASNASKPKVSFELEPIR